MKTLIETFYTGFSQQDAAMMISCYHEDVVFTDPVFGTLQGDDAKKMWQMLCKNGKDLKIEYRDITANDTTGSAHWEAWYTFSKTGRTVHNRVQAQFEFKEGKISKHTDDFSLHRWASQALGWKGFLLGGTSFFQKKLQGQVLRMLDTFEQ